MGEYRDVACRALMESSRQQEEVYRKMVNTRRLYCGVYIFRKRSSMTVTSAPE